MSQVLYEHTAQTAADLRHRNISTVAASTTSIMAAGSDPEPVEEPVATGDAKSHQSHSSHTTATHYVGLPYQDHNYGAPPPPTPPQSPPPSSVATASIFPGINCILDVEKPIAVPSLIPPAIPLPAPEPVDHKDEGETRCICNFDHDDGYMICCDRCGVWQHVECMGLDRNNIPDKYFCEKCQPRQVDKIKAHELQSKKRELINSDSSSDSGEEETSVAPNTTTYMAISNSPTSLTLTTAKHKKLKKKKKKRSKEKEHSDDKHHKRRKRKHSRKNSGSKPEETPSSVEVMDEEARPPWSDSEEHHDRYEEAAFNHYSADVQQKIATLCQKQTPSINSIRQPKLRTLGQKAKLGKNGVGLIASEELKKNEFIIEYKGRVMLSEQLDMKLPFFNSTNPLVLMYSKFSKLDICIDANTYGNEARFVRRSCNPNAEIRHSFEDNTIHLSLYSLGNISKGSEVTIGFDYNYKACSFPVRCACKKKNCGIKKFRRKHHSEDGQNHVAIHHITRDEEFTKSESDPAGSLSSSNNKKRTVSPLRVSLSAHNAQNNAQPEPVAPVNGDDTNTSTSNVESSAQENQPSEPQTPSQPARKLTREERKMEAIMKAIEKMEKTEKRRQQALERIAVSKQQQQEQQQEQQPEQKQQQKEEDKSDESKVGQTKETSDPKSESKAPEKEREAVENEQVKSNSAAEESSSSAPQVTTKPRPNNRRRKKGASKRRSRVNSAASTTTTSGAELSSMDEESNSVAPTSSSATTTVPTSTDNHQLLTTVPRTTATTSTSSASGLSLTIPSSLSSLVTDPQTMSSPIPACSKHFKFPKTKKFFMNEWLNEKALEASANKPLSIKTEPLDLIAASVSSPSTPTQLSKSASCATVNTPLKTNPDGGMGGNLGGSMGSAKKRWLRQAMSDNSKKTTSISSGADSPMCNGTLSPHHPASPALSPNSSMNDLMMTPLKKRMLRHSIAEDRVNLNQSSTPPLPSDKPATAPSTPTADVRSSNDETSKSSEAAKEETDQAGGKISAASRLELSFDGVDDMKRRTVPFPFPLPARKDIRKNSSVDSGLSVTTPADFDRSPVSIAGADTQTLENSLGKSSPIKCDSSVEKVSDVEERTSERTSPSVRNSVECKKELSSVEEPNKTSVQERTAKELDKPGDDLSPVSKLIDNETPVKRPNPGGIAPSSSAQVKLDFSLSESQNSSSSLERSQGSLPDLHSSCASAPELRQPPTTGAAASKADLSQSAPSANFEWTPNMKADVRASVYSTPPRKWDRIREEDPSKVNGDLSHARMRRLSGPVDFRRRPASETDSTRKSWEGGFADDQISGNTSLYTSFASPKKKTLMMIRNSEALVQEQKQTSERTEASQSDTRTLNSLPDRTDGEKDSGKNHISGLQSSEPSRSSHLSPTSSASSSSNGQELTPSQTPSMTSPSAGSAPPGPPLSSCLSPHPGTISPARSSGGTSPLLNSPNKLVMSPTPGARLSPGGSLPPSVASPPPGTPPVKRKVSLLEYRKRKVSAGKSSSSSSSSTSTTTTSASAPTTPIKPTVPIPTKSGLPTLPTLPIFNLKTKAVAEEATPKGRRLSLTSDAVQAITSLTSFLKDKGKPINLKSPPQDDNWRSNKVASASNEDPLQKLRKELDEKNKERERRDSHNSLKRPRSPEPPPPPPSKKPSSSHQPPAKKSNTGLRLQIPPPPPPKTKASDSRSGENSAEVTPPVHSLNRPNLHKSPGSAGTPPAAGAVVPGTPPVRKQAGIPGTPPVRANPAAAVPGTPPVLGNLAAAGPVQVRPNAMHPTYPQAPAQPYNPNFPQPQQQQAHQYQAAVPQPHQYPQVHAQAQPVAAPQIQPAQPAVPQQHPVQPVHQQQPPPPPQTYNYQGYQPQQGYQEKQGTAAVIEQFTKFHNQQQQQQQQQQQHNNQQYQQNVYNAVYQQAQNYQAAPAGHTQQQQPYHNPSNQTHYTAGQQQQHTNSNSYSPRHGYYQ